MEFQPPEAESTPSILALVRELMPRLLSGTGPQGTVLREQYERAQVAEVDPTGTGFYVRFAIPADAPIADPVMVHGGPSAEAVLTSPHLGDAGAILWFDHGRISTLELYACGPWPADLPVEIGLVTPFPG